MTPGCAGCKSTLREGVRREQNEECRKRLENALTAAGNEKVVRAQTIILESATEDLEEQEQSNAQKFKLGEEAKQEDQ